MFYATGHQVHCRFDKDYMAFAITMIWCHTHKQIHTAHTRHSWQMVSNPYFMKTPLYCLPPFFHILSNPQALFVALFLWLNMWSSQNWRVILIIMDLNLLSLGTSSTLLCVFKRNGTKNLIYRSFHMNEMVFASTLIWYHCTLVVHVTFVLVLTPSYTLRVICGFIKSVQE